MFYTSIFKNYGIYYDSYSEEPSHTSSIIFRDIHFILLKTVTKTDCNGLNALWEM